MPSSEVRAYQVAVPAGTAIAAPVIQDVSFPGRIVDSVTWRVPPGPSGLVGWRIMSSKTQVIPKNIGGWIVTDGMSANWELEEMPDSGDWQIQAYNTDIYQHTLEFTFLLSQLGREWRPVQLHTAASLAPVPDLSHAGPPVPGRR